MAFNFSLRRHKEQPHAVFGGFTSISGAWMLICKELIMAEDSPHITMQLIRTS